MTDKQLTELKESLEHGVNKAIDTKLGKLFVEREKHFLDHQFVGGIREGIETTRKGGLLLLGGSIITGIGLAVNAWISSFVSKGGP